VETSAHKLRFAYSTINWGTTPDLDAVFSEIRDAGWRAVELFVHSQDWLGTRTHLLSSLGGLQVATNFGVVEVPTNNDQLTKLKNQIDYSAEFGAEAIGLVGGARLRWRSPSDDEYADLARFCEELAIHGADKGVAVAYHPHVACTIETEDEIDRLMDQTKVLTLCLDASHIALVDEDPIAHIRKYRERTSYIHLKDWARGKFVEMGQGTLGIKFGAIFKELEENKFGGWVVVEQSRSDVSPSASAQANAAFVKNLGYSLELSAAA
jgi:sugar phosphate isomerase/epimerase